MIVIHTVVIVEASAPRAYSRVTLSRVRALSGSVVRNLRSGEGLQKILCLFESSLGHLRNQCSIVCTGGITGGVKEVGVHYQGGYVTVHTIANRFAIIWPGESTIHLSCQCNNWWGGGVVRAMAIKNEVA